MTQFDLLPTELQIEVFSYLRTADVKAARRVSKRLRDNATPVLFRSIVACARYEAMGTFQTVSLHPIYSSYVREIVFDGSVFEAGLAQSESLYHSAWSSERPAALRTSYWQRRKRWKQYQTMYQEQEDMNTSGVLLHTIARSLEWMKHVSSLVYSPHQHLIPTEVKDMRDVLPHSCGVFTSSSSRTRHFTSSDHAFRHLVGAVYISNYQGIRELRVEPHQEGIDGTEFPLSMFHFPEPEDFQAGRHLFRKLTKLELNIPLRPFFDATESDHARQLANLAKLIVTAADLQNLSVHIPRKRFSHPMYSVASFGERPIFPYLGLGATWPRLQSLSLKGVCADTEDVKCLIQRHKDTLRTLVFRNCTLWSGAWTDVIDEVLFHSSITAFYLHQVDERSERGVVWTIDDELKGRWSYEGHLVVSDGDRNFVGTFDDKKSSHDSQRDI